MQNELMTDCVPVSEEVLEEILSQLPEKVRDDIRERRIVVVGRPVISASAALILVAGALGMSDTEIAASDEQRFIERMKELQGQMVHPQLLEPKRKTAQWMQDRYHPFRRKGIPR